jgi:hypothetical protein
MHERCKHAIHSREFPSRLMVYSGLERLLTRGPTKNAQGTTTAFNVLPTSCTKVQIFPVRNAVCVQSRVDLRDRLHRRAFLSPCMTSDEPSLVHLFRIEALPNHAKGDRRNVQDVHGTVVHCACTW